MPAVATTPFVARKARPEDMVHVINIDVKSFYEAWDDEQWEVTAAQPDLEIRVICVQDTPVAVGVFMVEEYDPSVTSILKIAVLPGFRRRGYSRDLLQFATGYARYVESKTLQMVVPESLVIPGYPDDVSGWLKALRFKANGISRNEFTIMGRREDGIRFTQPVPGMQ